MACNCKDITPQSKECYEQMITIEIPDHMSKYRDNRVKAGLSSKISIDPCIFVEIWQLWQKGIITYGSCCGHNGKNPSFVNVDESNIQQMLDMGYLPNHYDLQRLDTFALKSAGGHYDDAGESNCTIFDVSGCYLDIDEQNTALTAIIYAKQKTHESQPGYERLEKLEKKLEGATKAYYNNR